MLLKLDNVDTYYGPIHILQGVSLDVNEGELVCLLGGERLRQVDDAETIIGMVRPRRGAVEFRRRGGQRAGRPATGSAGEWRSCPRTAACSGRCP